jgi:hypothetical protein
VGKRNTVGVHDPRMNDRGAMAADVGQQAAQAVGGDGDDQRAELAWASGRGVELAWASGRGASASVPAPVTSVTSPPRKIVPGSAVTCCGVGHI